MKTLFKQTLLWCAILLTCQLFAQALGWDNHRIAISADGNKQADNHPEARWPRADPDDWAGTPAAIAMLGHAGLQNKLVHYSYNNFIGAPPHTTETNHMDNSVQGAISRWNFDSSIFFDVPEDNAAAITHLANELKKSTASDPLYFIHMGPAEFFYLAVEQAIAEGGLEALAHVQVISHSGYNDDHLRRFAHHTMSQTITLSGDRIKYQKIIDQNACDNPDRLWCSKENYAPYHWMRDSVKEELRWLYTRMQIPGGKAADISDSGMVWYLLKNDELGNPDKLRVFMGEEESTGGDITTPCEDKNYNGIQDFEMSTEPGFVPQYKDTGRNAVGVNAGAYKDQFGATKKEFDGPTGIYDITITSLTEEDGESTYRLKVDGTLVGSFQNPEVEKAGDMQPHTHTFQNVAIKRGDYFQIESNTHTNGKIPEGNGTAWARGRWRSVAFKCLQVTANDPVEDDDKSNCLPEEIDGLLIFEAERFELKGDWALGTDTAASGGKYIYFAGPNSYQSVKPENNISYTFKINNPGTYTFKWTMRQEPGEQGTDLANDAWFYFSDDIALGRDKDKNDLVLSRFYKFVGRSDNTFSLNGSVEVNHAQSWVRAVFPSAGEYTLNLSGRSHGFQLDRIILYRGIAYDDLPAELAKVAETLNCGDATPTAITLTPNPFEVRVGTSDALTASFTPVNANTDVTWTSSNNSLATVDNDGNVTGVAEGTVTITATSTVDNSIVGTATVNIVAFFAIPVTGVSVTPPSSNIFTGSTLQLEANIQPSNADNKNVTWASSNESLATVDTNGKVTAIGDGVVTITATTEEGNFMASSEITIGTPTPASIKFDDANKYKTTAYYEDGKVIVTVNYHAGSGHTVQSDGGAGIRYRLRHLDSGWKVQNDYVASDATAIDTESGTSTVEISLAGAIPTAELPTGDFYWLWVTLVTSDGNERIQVSVKDLNILEKELSTDSFDLQSKISFYPNPAKDAIYLNDDFNNENAIIYDINGKEVSSQIVSGEDTIDIQGLTEGIYFLNIGKKTAKFVKE